MKRWVGPGHDCASFYQQHGPEAIPLQLGSIHPGDGRGRSPHRLQEHPDHASCLPPRGAPYGGTLTRDAGLGSGSHGGARVLRPGSDAVHCGTVVSPRSYAVSGTGLQAGEDSWQDS